MTAKLEAHIYRAMRDANDLGDTALCTGFEMWDRCARGWKLRYDLGETVVVSDEEIEAATRPTGDAG